MESHSMPVFPKMEPSCYSLGPCCMHCPFGSYSCPSNVHCLNHSPRHRSSDVINLELPKKNFHMQKIYVKLTIAYSSGIYWNLGMYPLLMKVNGYRLLCYRQDLITEDSFKLLLYNQRSPWIPVPPASSSRFWVCRNAPLHPALLQSKWVSWAASGSLPRPLSGGCPSNVHFNMPFWRFPCWHGNLRAGWEQ